MRRIIIILLLLIVGNILYAQVTVAPGRIKFNTPMIPIISTDNADSITVASGVPYLFAESISGTTQDVEQNCNGSYELVNLYAWFYSYDKVTWTFITTTSTGNLSLSSFAPRTKTTYFRRQIANYCNYNSSFSNILTMKVLPIISGSKIFTENVICSENDSLLIRNLWTVIRKESANNITFSWEKKVGNAWVNVPFVYPGDTTAAYTYGPYNLRSAKIKGSGTYRRKVSDNLGNYAYSNELEVQLTELFSNIAPLSQTLSSGQTATALTAIVSPTTSISNAIYSYIWQSTTDTTTNNWNTITGATSKTYSPPTTNNTTTFYRCFISSNICSLSTYTPIASVIYTNIVLAGGSITNPTLNVNAGTNVGSISSSVAATGGTSPYSYSWQKNNNNNWVLITGANTSTYDAGVMNQTTSFRRKVTDSNNDSAFSNVLTFNVQYSTLKAGLIGKSVTVCPNSDTTIYEIVAACGGYNTLTYSWEYNTGSGWTSISNSNTPNYIVHNIIANTSYRRKVTDGIGNSSYCNEVSINIYPDIIGGTLSPAEQTICISGSQLPEELVLVQNYHYTNGSVTYQWQKASSANGPWTDLSGVTQAVYRPKITNQVFYYRVKATSTMCNTVGYSNTVVVNINNACKTAAPKKINKK